MGKAAELGGRFSTGAGRGGVHQHGNARGLGRWLRTQTGESCSSATCRDPFRNPERSKHDRTKHDCRKRAGKNRLHPVTKQHHGPAKQRQRAGQPREPALPAAVVAEFHFAGAVAGRANHDLPQAVPLYRRGPSVGARFLHPLCPAGAGVPRFKPGPSELPWGGRWPPMQWLWCWRCKSPMPMLDEDEYAEVMAAVDLDMEQLRHGPPPERAGTARVAPSWPFRRPGRSRLPEVTGSRSGFAAQERSYPRAIAVHERDHGRAYDQPRPPWRTIGWSSTGRRARAATGRCGARRRACAAPACIRWGLRCPRRRSFRCRGRRTSSGCGGPGPSRVRTIGPDNSREIKGPKRPEKASFSPAGPPFQIRPCC